EFIDRDSYDSLMRLIKIAQFIRDTTGLPVTVNNWILGGQYNHSGFRPPACTIGSKTSEHRSFNAIDVKIKGWSGQQMQTWAIQNAKALYDLGVRRIEDVTLTPTWLHLDCKPHAERVIKIIGTTKIVAII